MPDTSLIHRLLAAEARAGSATRSRMLLGLVAFVTALGVAGSHTALIPINASAPAAPAASLALQHRGPLSAHAAIDPASGAQRADGQSSAVQRQGNVQSLAKLD
jgi:hypothetical protein